MVQFIQVFVPNHWIELFLCCLVLNFVFLGQIVIKNDFLIRLSLILVVDAVNNWGYFLIFAKTFAFFLKNIDELIDILPKHIVLVVEFSKKLEHILNANKPILIEVK